MNGTIETLFVIVAIMFSVLFFAMMAMGIKAMGR